MSLQLSNSISSALVDLQDDKKSMAGIESVEKLVYMTLGPPYKINRCGFVGL